MDAAGRACDLLERLKDSRLGAGLSEEDLQGISNSAAFCQACVVLAAAINDGSAAYPPADSKLVQGAVEAVKRAAVTLEADGSGAGRLDTALKRLDRALDKQSRADDRLTVLERLLARLQALRLINHNSAEQPMDVDGSAVEAPQPDPELAEDMQGVGGDAAEISALIQDLAASLNVDHNPQSAADCLHAVHAQIDKLLPQLPTSFFEPLISRDTLTDQQVQALTELHGEMWGEYRVRRRMLMERIKVTLQSFMWAERLKDSPEAPHAQASIDASVAGMRDEPAVSVEDIFIATQGDLVPISSKVTSGAKGSFASLVKGVIIGSVPDRGGRTEGRANAAGMPSWAPRQGGGGGGGGRRGGRRPGGGGRGQGHSQKGPGGRRGGGSQGTGKRGRI
ncbi:hypothetical protein WJX84_004327 [Apatococcus fuscideae]|uniref:Protein FAM98B n=1 Tax=Apatococcus fuscideae TaxID=2026836 RepID=A0AAW1RU83_9CHLO